MKKLQPDITLTWYEYMITVFTQLAFYFTIVFVAVSFIVKLLVGILITASIYIALSRTPYIKDKANQLIVWIKTKLKRT